MKINKLIALVIAAAAILTVGKVKADVLESDSPKTRTNSLSLTARFGFNVSAKFKNLGRFSIPGTGLAGSRLTPDGDRYNYDDGYALKDAAAPDGQTWYWGYDDSASQVSGNNILMHRTAASGSFATRSADDDPSLGAELVFRHQLGVHESFIWGVEAAVNYQNISISDNRPVAGNVSTVTDSYAYTPGTTPPSATPGSPYQGPSGGPGFVISDTPNTSVAAASAATLSGRRQIDSDIWGFRLGPYIELPIVDSLNFSVSGGLAFALLNNEASWNETLTVGTTPYSIKGSGNDNDLLFGYYLAANLAWQFSERWSAVGGFQYQDLGTYDQAIGGRRVLLDLSESMFVTIGLGYTFK